MSFAGVSCNHSKVRTAKGAGGFCGAPMSTARKPAGTAGEQAVCTCRALPGQLIITSHSAGRVALQDNPL